MQLKVQYNLINMGEMGWGGGCKVKLKKEQPISKKKPGPRRASIFDPKKPIAKGLIFMRKKVGDIYINVSFTTFSTKY